LYTRLGEARGVREFVDKLYDFMEFFPAIEELRKIHPDDLTEYREQLFMLLSGMLGGPSLYYDQYGLPYPRPKYMCFNMTELERDQWLFCAQNAVNQLQLDALVRDELMSELTVMVNQVANQHIPSTEQFHSQNNYIH
jgi:hemoglobin